MDNVHDLMPWIELRDGIARGVSALRLHPGLMFDTEEVEDIIWQITPPPLVPAIKHQRDWQIGGLLAEQAKLRRGKT